MKIAVIGSGIAGLTSAHYLAPHADVTLYEKAHRLGGHTATVDVTVDGREYAVDTGFIVYNERTYPNFIRLLDALGVRTKPTTMGFSVSSRMSGLEYSGSGLKGLFAQKSNWLNWQHWRMIRDILRFNKQAPRHLEKGVVGEDMQLGEYLKQYRYSDAFRDYYLVPMGAAIWSASTEAMLEFPMKFFIQFFSNHGLLQVKNRPQWYVIEGGSRSYIPALSQPFKDNIRLNAGVKAVIRQDQQVIVVDEHGDEAVYDDVVFACHSDEALAMLDASNDEQAVLGRMPYQNNEVVLHTDESLLPATRAAWSSWNYALYAYRQEQATLTYNMNILQGLQAPVTFCVTLNDTRSIDTDKCIASFNYAHPVFTLDSVKAQQQWPLINGVKNTWFCGAYWRNGFHEDGVVSALWVVNGLLKKMGKPEVPVLDYTAGS